MPGTAAAGRGRRPDAQAVLLGGGLQLRPHVRRKSGRHVGLLLVVGLVEPQHGGELDASVPDRLEIAVQILHAPIVPLRLRAHVSGKDIR